MADINGTAGNDIHQLSTSNSLSLTLSGTIAEGARPIINVLINGSVVLSNVTITADANLGATQVIDVPVPPGVSVSSIGLQYTNDDQTDFAQDRNLLVSSVNLNGQNMPISAVSYTRLAGGEVFDTINGDQWLGLTGGVPLMKWGGTLTLSGPAVTGATGTGGGGNLSVDGGAGIDTLMLDGARSNFDIFQNGAGFTVDRISGGETLSLTNVERLHFQSGANHALDMNGNAGTTVEIISALFGQSFVSNTTFVGIGISLLDGGMTPLQLVALAESTPLFQQLAGSSSNTDFVKLVYQNVVGVAPSADQLNSFVSLLDNGTFTQASLGLLAAEHSLNQAHLVGLLQTGVYFD
jgi:hypothetical protein